MTNKDINLLGIDTDIIQDNGKLVRKNTQEITQSFIDDLAHHRNEAAGKREGEFMRVASIPTVIVEKWMSEGFNIFDKNINGREIVKRLKQENLDAFLTTDKQI